MAYPLIPMKTTSRFLTLLVALATISLVTPVSAVVDIAYVPVGNAGNAADTTGYGSVAYSYKIGKYEVTNAQYAEFLNAVDPSGSNPNGIYNASMGSDARGGITYTAGAASGAKYTIRTNMGDKPVNFVSWYDAARFCNWLGNGQGTGSTETGAYTLTGNTGIITKNSSPTVTAWIPSEDEWYKAAYYNPAASSYSLYPTQSNTAPTAAAADASGNISNPGANVANYYYGADWNGLDGNVTTVGSAGSASASFYGTFDQGGNVWEWNDAIIGSYRGLHGGMWGAAGDVLQSSYRYGDVPPTESGYIGFRVASVADTDGDGIPDTYETGTGIYVSPTNTGTNPNQADTDGDGVPDGLEVKEKTSPVDETKFNSFSRGLLVYCPMDGTSKDESGGGFDGTLVGGTVFVPDRYGVSGNAIGTDGVDGVVYWGATWGGSQLPYLLNNKTVLAMSVWIKPNVAVDSKRILMELGFSAFGIEGQTGAPGMQFYVNNHATSGVAMPVSQWTHVLMQIDGTNQSLYFNGVLVAQSAFSASISDSQHSFRIGGRATDLYANADFDDLRIYNRALSDSEISALNAIERPRYQIIQGSYTWLEAKVDAEARGGRLAVLDTQAKIDEADAFLQSWGNWPSLWIGGEKPAGSTEWRWINGFAMVANNWGVGEPNGAISLALNPMIWSNADAQPLKWSDDRGSVLTLSYLLENPDVIFTLSAAPTTNGTVTGTGEYQPNATATLTAVPAPGFAFTGWTGSATGTTNPLSIAMDSNKTVGATFAPDLTDSDTDGLTAYDEVVTYGTDPTKDDTDGDGLKDGWEIGLGRFSIISGSFTWPQASNNAHTRGGELACFPSADRWNRAMETLGANALDPYTGLWIGATDATTEGIWKWVNGETYAFTNWGTGRPSTVTGNTLDYVEVSGGGGAEIGKWYDRSPSTIRDGYILETGYPTDPLVADADGDGLNDGAEQAAGSNPFMADTDGDGLSDSQEVNITQTNPKLADSNGNGTHDALEDPDADGLSNLAEVTQYGTDPLVEDSDADGIKDGAEVGYAGSFFKLVQGSFTYAQAVTDAAAKGGRVAGFPNSTDYTRAAGKARQATQGYLWIGLSDAATEGTWLWTDGTNATYTRWLNGQPDGGAGENHVLMMENSQQWADGDQNYVAAGYLFERVGLDPLDPDTDADGLPDGQEVSTTHSSPVLDDTDGDGLLDGAEVNTHGSSPLLADTDADGLNDRVEVEVYHSNPALKDSDGDGFDDLFEVNTGFDPALATSTPDALSTIRTAVEFRFNAANEVSYRIEASTDLNQWDIIEPVIIGESAVVTRFYSTENMPKRYFRVRRN
jgi:sulfatase modifying factor 1